MEETDGIDEFAAAKAGIAAAGLQRTGVWYDRRCRSEQEH